MYLAPAFGALRERAVELKGMRNAGAKVLVRWQRLSLCRVFLKWHTKYLTTKKCMMIARKIFHRWNHMKSATAFSRWLEQVEGQKALCDVTTRVVKWWMMKSTAQGWGKWHGELVHARMARRAAAKWLKRSLYAAFAILKERVHEGHNMRRIASMVCARWSSCTTAQSWKCWREDHVNNIKIHKLSRKILMQWTRGALSHGWDTWFSVHAEKTRLGMIGARVLLRWGQLELGRPWLGWQQRTAQKKKLDRAANKVLMRWSKASLFPAFHSWLIECAVIKQRATVANKVVKRWTQMQLATALNRWTEQAAQQGALWELTTKIIKHWTQKEQAWSWDRWRCQVAEAQRLSHVFGKIAKRWKCLHLSKGWIMWTCYLESQRAADQLEDDIRKTFARIERSFATAFAKWLLEQWHLVSSSRLAADYRLMGMSVLRWHQFTAQSIQFKQISSSITSNSLARRKSNVYSLILWECLQFKASHRDRVLSAFQRMRQRRLAGRFVLNWFFTVKSACEEEAHMEEEHQIAKSKFLAHFLNEWRVVAVKQKDLRESASTIAQQWEREITLKRKLATEVQAPVDTPDRVPTSSNRNSANFLTRSANSSSNSQPHMTTGSKGMWSDMPVLTTGQQHPADLGPFSRSKGSLNDPQLASRGTIIHTGLAGSYSNLELNRASATKQLHLKEAFKIWHQSVQPAITYHMKPKLHIDDLHSSLYSTSESKILGAPVETAILSSVEPSPPTKLKSPRGDAIVMSAVAHAQHPSSPKRASPRAGAISRSSAHTTGHGSMTDALGASLGVLAAANAELMPKDTGKGVQILRPESPVQTLQLAKLIPLLEVTGLRSTTSSTASQPAASQDVPAKSQGFFADNVLHLQNSISGTAGWMGALSAATQLPGAASSEPRTLSASSESGWLGGLLATPRTPQAVPPPSPQPAHAPAQSWLHVAPAPAPARARVKNELVPSPRNFEMTTDHKAKADAEIAAASAAAHAAPAASNAAIQPLIQQVMSLQSERS